MKEEKECSTCNWYRNKENGYWCVRLDERVNAGDACGCWLGWSGCVRIPKPNLRHLNRFDEETCANCKRSFFESSVGVGTGLGVDDVMNWGFCYLINKEVYFKDACNFHLMREVKSLMKG